MGNGLLTVQIPRFLQLPDNQRIGILEKHTVIIVDLGSKTAVPRHRLEQRQIVFFGDLIVIGTECRCNMHDTGTVLG